MEDQSITKLQANSLRNELRAATASGDAEWFKQATLLMRVYYAQVGKDGASAWQAWGFESWHDYVEVELGLHHTTAQRMVSTARFFVLKMAGIWNGKILSRQRMQLIASHAPAPKELNRLMEKAATITVCELQRELEGGVEQKKAVTFNMSPAEAQVLKEAVDSLMATGEFATRGEALVSVFKTRRLRVA